MNAKIKLGKISYAGDCTSRERKQQSLTSNLTIEVRVGIIDVIALVAGVVLLLLLLCILEIQNFVNVLLKLLNFFYLTFRLTGLESLSELTILRFDAAGPGPSLRFGAGFLIGVGSSVSSSLSLMICGAALTSMMLSNISGSEPELFASSSSSFSNE